MHVNFDTTNALGVPKSVHYTEDSLHQGSPDRTQRYREYKNCLLHGRVRYIKIHLYYYNAINGPN